MRGKLRINELINALGVGLSTFHRWRRAGYLPKASYYRGMAVFDAAEVLTAIEDHGLRVTPAGYARLNEIKEKANAQIQNN